MRISRLELHGFKSFPDRTTFHFGPGISCVVGPNGSGKSNVVDALKWCVGEQSARSLRGAEMSDVIFAGSTDRKPVGYAEVVLTLRAEEGGEPFPGEYAQLHELQVGRRLHRTGASEYFVNQTRVRRRDVVELLLDSGIGNNLYSFIEQGQVDKMITASPAERRSLIDEAAGIARYKARRDEAQQRLVTTASQLDRAADVLDEMTRRLRVLENQVLVAGRFRRFRALLRQGELRLALVKHHALSQDRRALRHAVDELRGKEEGARREVVRREEDLLERREELAVTDALSNARRDEVAELDGRVRELEATALLHDRRRAELAEEAERATLELRRQRGVGDAALADVAAAKDEVGEHSDRLDGLARALAEADLRLAAERAGVAAARAEVDAAQHGLDARVAERSKADAGASLSERVVGERLAAAERGSASVVELGRRVLEAGRQVDEAVAAGRRVEAEAGPLDGAVAGAEEEVAVAQAAEAEAGAALRVVEAERDRVLAARLERQKERDRAADRGRRWLDALRTDRAGTSARWEAEGRRELAALEQRLGLELQRALSERDARVAREQAALKAASEAASRAAAARVASATAAVAAAEKAAAAAVRDRASDEGRAKALEAELEAVNRRLSTPTGTAKLRAAIGEVRSLWTETAPERRAEVVRRLGDAAEDPVVRDRAVLQRVAATGEPASVWYWPPGAPHPVDLVGWEDELGAALGASRPTAGPGFRTDGTGGVRFGPPGELSGLMGRQSTLETQLSEARARLDLARTRVGGCEADTRAAHAALQDARVEERAAVERGRQALEQAIAGDAADRRQVEESGRQRAREESAAARHRAEERRASADAAAVSRVAAAEEVLERFLADRPVDESVPDPAPAREAAERARRRVRDAIERRELARRARQALAARVAEAAGKLTARRADLERLEAAVEEARRAEVAAAAAVTEARAARVAATERAARAVADEGVARALLAEARGRLVERESVSASAVQARSRLELERAATTERRAAAERRAQEASGRVQAAEADAGRAREQVDRALASAAEASEARDQAHLGAAESRASRATAWDAFENLKQRAQKLGEGVQLAERTLRQHRTKLEELGREIEGASVRVAAAQQELEVLRRGMEDRYQVSLPAWLDRLHARGRLEIEAEVEAAAGVEIGAERVEPVEPLVLEPADLSDEAAVVEVVEELELHRAALASLGEVNLGASAEYRELRARVDELEGQRADLEHGMEQIRSAIARLNRECRERFRETFDLVNDHFRTTYPRLVGGGSARLALTDDEDLLETGVEIFVQPPGKRLQNLTLLSGGEKAMTAIALLIALFRVKPSPFCVLDEVDAPLDEANGARFNDMLREMSQRSQFLVVTHNRKTMECADTLYGVTMSRPGVSKLVSVQLPT